MSQKQKWFYSDQKRKSMNFNLKIKLNGKRLNETNSVKFLGIRIDKNLTGKPILTILHLN